MANVLALLADGWREIGRKAHRFSLRRRLVAADRDRQQALTRLGQAAWQSKVDLSELGGLRGQLEQIDARAGDLSATATRLDAERADLQARRQAEVDRFDALLAPAKLAQSQADTALRAARAALAEKDRAIRTVEAQLARLGKEDTGTQRAALTQQAAAETAAKAPLASDVDTRTAEGQRCAAETARLEAERKAALQPIDSELDRLRQASATAAHDRAAVGRDQDQRFLDLGAALYERRTATDPALAECVQAVAAVDADRTATQAQIDGSLGQTHAMAPGTVAKFGAVVLLVPVLLVAAGYVVYGRLGPSESVANRGPVTTGKATGTATGVAPAIVRASLVAEEERRKDEAVLAYTQAPTDPNLRKKGVETLAADVIALGSSADRSSLPMLLIVLERGEPELRAAAAKAVGMIGPTAAEAPALVKAFNDPMPAVRDEVLPVLARLPDPGARLLAQRVRSAARDGEQPKLSGLKPTVPPDAARLGTPIYPDATFLAFASDLEIGRVSFSSADPVQKVVDHYAAAAAGRPPVGAQEFTRLYFGGTASDPSGAEAMSEALQAWYRQAAVAGTPPAEVQVEFARRVRLLMSLPLKRYAEATLYGDPVFIALEVAAVAGKTQVVRHVVVFQDHSLGRTGFEYHVAADAPRK